MAGQKKKKINSGDNNEPKQKQEQTTHEIISITSITARGKDIILTGHRTHKVDQTIPPPLQNYRQRIKNSTNILQPPQEKITAFS